MSNDQGSRLIWAPLIGNGFALITLGGIVGNVPSPDTALKALAPALALFAAGLLAGAWAASIESDIQSHWERLPDFRSTTYQIGERNAKVASELAELRWRDQHNITIRDKVLLDARIAILGNEMSTLISMSNKLDRDASHSERTITPIYLSFSTFIKNVALVCFAMGVISIVVPVSQEGLHLERNAVSAEIGPPPRVLHNSRVAHPEM
ncbi:hypothetical protein [Caulobacter sp. DWR1-3-2b1]|uniref:hypothetical protein n=1 Tax=Caulobacter sp. DWR1-3-2b1 TaxID=2804670 RepID=UPI003CF51B9E